jgi:cytochrome P450
MTDVRQQQGQATVPGAPETAPVADWATDYDVLDPGYVVAPYDVWARLRVECPVAHTERWGGSFMPTRMADVAAVAHDVERFSSRDVGVVGGDEPPEGMPDIRLPPIDFDPPDHTWARRLILPWFSHQRVDGYEAMTRAWCNELIDRVIATGHADAAQDYAQRIPVRVISWMLGVPDELNDTFTGWVRDVLEYGHDPERSVPGWNAIAGHFIQAVEDRRTNPTDDLVTELLQSQVDGEPVPVEHVLGILALILVAGIDTTWSGIGSAMWHLATHEGDRRRLVAEPELIPTAVEELLRAYSPVTMARIAAVDTEVAGCPVHEGDRILLSFPAANRDPEAFERADEVVIDRALNRHVAFGVGIHRCAGSNLARMELRVAVEEWLRRIPEFRIVDGAQVTWAGGQVRGPRSVPVEF